MRIVSTSRHRPRRAAPPGNLLAGLILLAMLQGCTLSKAEETEERSATLAPGKALRIVTRNGRIAVSTGAPGKVKVKAVKKARSSSNPEALLKEIKVKLVPGPEGLTLSAEHPAGSLTRQYGVSFTVSVPPGTPVTAETRNGAVRVTGTDATVRVTAHNGSVHVTAARGEAHLKTKNGSIHFSGTPSRFALQSGNGSIRVTLDSAATLAGPSSATTHNGSITVRAPASFRGRIDASTHNGRVRSELPTGDAATAGPSLKLRTHNGSIRIRKL